MKLLLIEDDHDIAEALIDGLTNKGFVVDWEENGESGLDMAIDEVYDAILLDWMLPDMNGLEICDAIRSEQKTTPILMLTAKDDLESKVSGLNMGADDYLTKPFEFAELVARIQALLRRPAHLESNKRIYKDVVVDLQTQQVTRDGNIIELSKKEYDLLSFFVMHPEQVFSKQKLIEQVWPYDTDVLPNTVEVYVGYLRNKLDKQFPNKTSLLQTARGFGYVLREES